MHWFPSGDGNQSHAHRAGCVRLVTWFDDDIRRIADEIGVDPRSIVRRLAGLPVRGRIGLGSTALSATSRRHHPRRPRRRGGRPADHVHGPRHRSAHRARREDRRARDAHPGATIIVHAHAATHDPPSSSRSSAQRRSPVCPGGRSATRRALESSISSAASARASSVAGDLMAWLVAPPPSCAGPPTPTSRPACPVSRRVVQRDAPP